MLDALQTLNRQPVALHGITQPVEHLVPLPPYPDLPASAPPLPRGQYGVTPQDGKPWTAVIEQQIAAFTAFQQAAPCLAKPGKPVAHVTLDKVVNTIRTFLGYVALALRQPLTLGLALVLQPSLVTSFIRAKMAAGQAQQSIIKVVGHLTKVVAWFRSQQISARDQAQLPSMQQWFYSMGGIILNSVSKKRRCIAEMQQQGTWTTAPQLVAAIAAFHKRTEHLLLVAILTEQVITQALCRQVHDACLAMTLFGWLPPLRLSCVAGLTLDGAGCAARDCSVPGCLGNRLQLPVSGGQSLCSMHLPHHKTEHRTGNAIVVERLPADLSWMLEKYVRFCRPTLVSKVKPARSVFLSVTGLSLSPSALSTYFKAVILPALGLSALHFPPVLLRHIFVCQRLDEVDTAAAAVGPVHDDAALAMGNSVRMWQRAYHLNRDSTGVSRSVNAMPGWRASMLAQAAQQQS